MPVPNREEWQKIRKVEKTKQNLRRRQRKLAALLRRGRGRFRNDSKAQLELRRVAALCLRLEEMLRGDLQEEFVWGVMDS